MKHLAFSMSFILLFPSLAIFAQQADSTDAFKTKYELLRKQVNGMAASTYTNGLNAIAKQLKQKADLDAYLIVQAEQKRAATTPVIDDGLTNSNPAVVSLAQKVVQDRDSKVLGHLKQYRLDMEGQLKQLMLADKIDEAKEVKTEIDKVKFEIADLESKVPVQASATAVSSVKTTAEEKNKNTTKALIGKWIVKNKDNTGTWTFYEDGSVYNTNWRGGGWKMDNRRKTRLY